MKIRGIKAESTRGIPRGWPILPIGEKGAVIFGENGAGKSSFIDALEYALTGRSTLYPEDRMGVNWDTGSPHVRDGASDFAIAVLDGNVDRQVAFNAIPAELSPLGRDWMQSAARTSFMLRRHMLLRFISEQPKDRYALLEPFLNLEKYRQIEEALRTVVADRETRRIALDADINRLQDLFRSLFGISAGNPVTLDGLLSRINSLLTGLGIAVLENPNESADRHTEVSRILGDKAKSERVSAIGAIKSQIQRLNSVENLLPLLDGLVDATQLYEAQVSARSEIVITDLLVQGRRVITASASDSCPVCEQAIDRARVLARLETRINQDGAITRANGLVGERRKVLLDAVRQFRDSLQQITNDWQTTLGIAIPEQFTRLRVLLSELLTVLESTALGSAKLAEYRVQLIAHGFSYDDAVKFLEEKLSAEGDVEQRRIATEATALLNALMDDWPRLIAARRELEDVAAQRDIAQRIYGHAVSARKAAVQGVLQSVSETANQYYTFIHPNESIGQSKLVVREAATNSVNLTTSFHGTEEPPLLHFSESHLDTLGLCYFLALRRHETPREPTFKVLVLDDVLHSVDAHHRARVAQLLKEQFADHQMVVTTHDDFFFDILRQTFGTGFTYYRLANWSVGAGPVLADAKTDLDIILDVPGRLTRRPAELAASCGRFLESYLKQLTDRLDIALPARFMRKHDIGTLWPPTASKLSSRVAFSTPHGANVTQLTNHVWIRNACGAHHNEVATAVSAPEAAELASLVAALYAATHCDGERCGTSIAKRDNDNWTCNCGSLSYGR